MSFIGECSGCDYKVWTDDAPEHYWVNGGCNQCAGEAICTKCEEIFQHDFEIGCEKCQDGPGPCRKICDNCLDCQQCERCEEEMCIECSGGWTDFERCAGKLCKELCDGKLCKKCQGEHEVSEEENEDLPLPCGHAGCVLHDEEDGPCRICEHNEEKEREENAVDADKLFIENALGDAKSKIAKKHLQAALEELQATSTNNSKKRKHA